MGSIYKKVEDYIYNLGQPIAKGAYSRIYKAYKEKDPDVSLAMKVIPLNILREDEAIKNKVLESLKVLRAIKLDSVNKMIDTMKNNNNLYIVMDYCDGGDLENKLSQNESLTEEEACDILKQISLAFLEIENQNIADPEGRQRILIHQSINPHHILFKEEKVQLSGLSKAKLVTADHTISDNSQQDNDFDLYSSPQILNGDKYTSKCDIWSAGLVLYKMIFGMIPWKGTTKKELYNDIVSKELTFPRKVRSETEELLKKMLSLDEEPRPAWKEINQILSS